MLSKVAPPQRAQNTICQLKSQCCHICPAVPRIVPVPHYLIVHLHEWNRGHCVLV